MAVVMASKLNDRDDLTNIYVERNKTSFLDWE